MARKSISAKNKSNRPSRPGYDWVSDRRVKGGGYWRKKRSRLATIAGAGIGTAKTIAKTTASGVAGTVGAIAGTVGANAGSAVLGAGLAATTAGLAAIAARARRNGQSPTSPSPGSPGTPGSGNKNAAKATTVAAGAAGAAAAAALMRRKGVQSVNVEPPESSAPPGSGAAQPSSTAVSANPSPSSNRSTPTPTSTETPPAAGAAVLQKRASRNAVTAEEMLLPQSSKSQKGLGIQGVATTEQRLLPQSSKSQGGAGAGIADPWEGEVEPLQATNNKKGEAPSGMSSPMALPSASRKLSKAQLKKVISESRDLKSKRKRTETEIEKANNKIELGKSLQKKESDADKLRGIDYEMIASEKKANLEARLAEIESREKQLNELLSPKMPTRSGSTSLSSEGVVTPVPKGMEVVEKRRKKNNQEEVSAETPPQPESPVKAEETVKSKKRKRSIVQRVKNAVTRKKEETTNKETPKERRRRERAENKKLKQELIEQTGKSASKAMVRNAYKAPLNLVVPGLGDAIEKADKFFGDKSRIEKWAQELEDNGDINVTRRELFRGGRRFVAKQTAAKPKGVTQELRRGAEISKDFFDKLVGGNTDEIILKGSKRRGFGAARGTKIQLTKQEFDRITNTYSNPQKRQLLNFLDFIGFPIP